VSERPVGLGRGLAAILPTVSALSEDRDIDVDADGINDMNDGDPSSGKPGDGQMGKLSGELAAALAQHESGIALIYRALDALVSEFELEDAAIVVEEPGLGRQVFRAGRKPFDEDDEALLEAPAGLYTEPPFDDHDFDRDLVMSLCVLAIRMDVLRYDAWHDPLTGLFDRRSFDRLLEMAIARSNRYGWAFTLVMLDLDGLKAINDSGGHAAGDQALRDLGERFRRALRFGDNGARIGGDEFAMILPGTDAESVPILIDRIRNAAGFTTPTPEFSYGIAMCPDEADGFDTLFQLADERLYHDKQQRKAAGEADPR
jgi:diguanylate cyclase (GGDEF)-like protein